MKKYIGVILFISFQITALAQIDSTWTLMILKKGKQPEILDNMAKYNSKCFYLYENCYYDIEINNIEKKTLRLLEIKLDTLIFATIPTRKDTNNYTNLDTITLDYRAISSILLINNGNEKIAKRIKADEYYFVFAKSIKANKFDVKQEYIFSQRDKKHDLYPRLLKQGVFYTFEYNGKLYVHSNVDIKPQKYTDEEKAKYLNIAIKVLDVIVNKRIMIELYNSNNKK